MRREVQGEKRPHYKMQPFVCLLGGDSEYSVFNCSVHLLTGSKTGMFNPGTEEYDPRVKIRFFYFSNPQSLFNRYRNYDLQSGRFISKDPVGLAGGHNAHQYAPNPTGWIDPLGFANGGKPCLLSCNDYASQGPKNEIEMARELSNQINQNRLPSLRQRRKGI